VCIYFSSVRGSLLSFSVALFSPPCLKCSYVSADYTVSLHCVSVCVGCTVGVCFFCCDLQRYTCSKSLFCVLFITIRQHLFERLCSLSGACLLWGCKIILMNKKCVSFLFKAFNTKRHSNLWKVIADNFTAMKSVLGDGTGKNPGWHSYVCWKTWFTVFWYSKHESYHLCECETHFKSLSAALTTSTLCWGNCQNPSLRAS